MPGSSQYLSLKGSVELPAGIWGRRAGAPALRFAFAGEDVFSEPAAGPLLSLGISRKSREL